MFHIKAECIVQCVHEWQLFSYHTSVLLQCARVISLLLLPWMCPFLSTGLEEQGLYRVGGVSSKVSKLLSMGLDQRKAEKLNILDDQYNWESKTITSSLKTYLRSLPEPLTTFRYHNSFIAAASKFISSASYTLCGLNCVLGLIQQKFLPF